MKISEINNIERRNIIMLEQFVNKIKNAKTDEDIKKVLCDAYVAILMDSKVRKEFDEYINRNTY